MGLLNLYLFTTTVISTIKPQSVEWDTRSLIPNPKSALKKYRCDNMDEFFDSVSLQCLKCPENSVSDIDDPQRCACVAGFRKEHDYGGGAGLKCTPCPNGELATPDGWTCVQCDLASPRGVCDACFQADGGAGGGQRKISYVRSPFGFLPDGRAACEQCRRDTISESHYGHSFCVPCARISDDQKGCPCIPQNTVADGNEEGASDAEAQGSASATRVVYTGGSCFTKQGDLDLLRQLAPEGAGVSYTRSLQGTNYASTFMSHTVRASFVLCSKGNSTACQALANACALLNYHEPTGTEPNNACSLLRKVKEKNWQPSLYQPDTFIQQNHDKISTIYYLDDGAKTQLKLVASIYTPNGTFLGVQSVTNGLLQLCPDSAHRLNLAFAFGFLYRQRCQVPIRQLMHMSTMLFDLYAIANENDELFPLYHKVVGAKPTSLLFRRVFLVDNLSSRLGYDAKPSFVRYAAEITLNVQQRDAREKPLTDTSYKYIGDGRIDPPHLEIVYKDISASELDQLDMQVPVEFSVVYLRAASYAWRHDRDMEITLGILCSLGVLWALLRTWSWARRAGKQMVDMAIVLKFALYLAGILADVFLVVLLCASGYLWFAYKQQAVAAYMPLSPDQEYGMLVCLCVASALKFIALLHNRVEQMLTETFFIDWERPRGSVIPYEGEKVQNDDVMNGGDENDAENGGESGERLQNDVETQVKSQRPVTVWRTYMVANEWNELQNYRKTSVALQIVVMLFLLKIVHLEVWTLACPGFNLDTPLDLVADTRIHRFALGAGLYLLIGFIQWAVNVIVIERCLVDHFRNFMDLCSICNISVLALKSPLHGHYIHGRSPLGQADADMRQMNHMLQKEREDMCGRRGLEPGQDAQCFLVALTNEWRRQFDALREPLRTGVKASASRGTGARPVDPITAKVDNVIQVHENVNELLMALIEQRAMGAPYVIRNRSFIEALLDIEMQDFTQTAVFYRDPSDMLHSSAFLYGNEWLNLSFDCLIFAITDMFAQDFLLAACVTYVVSGVLISLSETGFTKNLIRSSLVDERFLI